jgi:adenine-specific DNA glycosylase
VCILTYQGRTMLFRRKERLLNGLYVFALLEDETDPASAALRLAEDGFAVTYRASLGEAAHAFTHRVWRMRLFHFELAAMPRDERLADMQAVAADAETLNALPLPAAMRAAKSAALAILDQAEEK